MTPHLFLRTYPADLASATRARHDVADVLLARNPGIGRGVIDDVQLVVSELTSNAVRHARSRFDLAVDVLSVDANADRIRVAVADDSPRAPVRRESPRDTSEGRGMVIVAAVAEDWGVDQLGHGKRVWADIRAAPRLHDPHASPPDAPASEAPADGRSGSPDSINA